VDLELVRESLGLLRGEGLVERGGRVGVQVVEDQDDPVSIGMADVDEVLDQPCPVLPGAVIGDGQVSGAQQGLAEAEDVGHTVASVLVVEALGQTGQRGQGRADLADQLLGHLIQTDQRTLRIEGSGVDVEDILHMVDELGVRLGRNHPLLLAPGSKLVCFKAWRTVSWETAGRYSNSTSLSARRRKLQRARPSGGAPQERAIR